MVETLESSFLPAEEVFVMAGILGRSRFQAFLRRCRCSSTGRTRPSENLERPLILCSAASSRRMSSGVNTEAGRAAAVRQQLEAAAREDRLDLFAAARILFSTPAKPKKFGLDFHLWQFFVSLLPPFAVYLTAQYARYEIRRMEKEKEQEVQLKLRAELAEQPGTTDDESKPSNTLIPRSESSEMQQEQKDDSKKVHIDESVIMLPDKDFLAMKARLDAMEVKVKLLESVRPGTTFIIPLDAEPNVDRVPTKQNIEQSASQVADQAKGGEGLQRKLGKQKSEIPAEVRNQEYPEVSQGSGRSWYGFTSKPKEKELSG